MSTNRNSQNEKLNALKERCKLSGFDTEKIEALTQQELARKLREAAINHLENGDGVVAKGFRGEYSAVSLGDSKNFLREQAKNGSWATYIEAQALGEKLGCNVVVTYQRPGKDDTTWCLYRASEDTPTVHLYNKNNTHWYVNNETIGDGNCLYNAFGQALQKFIFMINTKVIEPTPLTSQGIFKPIVIDETVKAQAAVINAIEKHPTPVDLEKNLLAQKKEEEQRLSKLPLEERQKIEKQIREDHELALRMAREESETPSYSQKSFK